MTDEKKPLPKGDLKALASKQTLRLQLEHPTVGKLEAWITLAGPAHPITQALAREVLDRHLAEPIKSEDQRMTMADVDRAKAETTSELVARTLGWEGLVEDGEPVEFSPEAARRLYEDPTNAWLRDFVNRSLSKSTLFFGA